MDKYLKLDEIGKGCNGNCVLKVKNLEDNRIYALKTIFIDVNDEEQNRKNMNEINIFKNLHHQNIVKYYESFIHKNKLCIVMEWADGGDLYQIIKKYTTENKQIEEESIWNWFLQLCQALKYIHSKKIIHRDIKAQNIFLTKKGQVKLGDFGISKELEDTMDYAKTSLGTPYFLSPEICSGNKYNFKTDTWMLGCVLYELSSLRKPFEGENLHKLITNILTCSVLPIPKIYSDELKTLIEMLLKKDPNLRPSIDEILSTDFVIEKLNKMDFNLFQSDSSNNLQASPKYTKSSNNLMNMNTKSINCNNISSSPSHENQYNLQMFNLGFGDNEVSEHNNDNSISISPINSRKPIKTNIQSSKNVNSMKNGSLFANKKEKKYSPSYGVNEMNELMKHLPITTDANTFYDEDNYNNYYQIKNDLYSKNQSQELEKLSIEEKIRRLRQRNKSINIDNSNKIQNINKNVNGGDHILSPEKKCHKKVHSIVSKHINSNSNSNNSTPNNTILSTINLNINNMKANSASSKYKLYKDNVSFKKKGPMQISLNISSVQSPEQKVIYYKENEKNSELDVEIHPIRINGVDDSAAELNGKKLNLIKLNFNHPKIYFLIQQFGEEKVSQLKDLLQNSRNPMHVLNDVKILENVIGEKYKLAQSMLISWLYDHDNA